MKYPSTGEPFVANADTVEMYELYGFGEYVTEGEVVELPAQKLWEHMIEGAHENGEPGAVFIDRFNKKHSFPVDVPEDYTEDSDNEYVMNATNPCGEQPLMEYESCNLGHINLSTLIAEDAQSWDEWMGDDKYSEDNLEGVVDSFLEQALDREEFNDRIRTGTHFLDNVVTMSDFPVDEIEETVRKNRKVGLGIMGLAQMYIQMGVEYGGEVANEIGRQIMLHINHESKWYSNKLVGDRGKFENWDDSKYADPTEYEAWFEQHTGLDADKWPSGFPIRNHNTTTIAPTGTTSMIGNTSGGCEPIYNVARFKNVSDDVQGDEPLVEFDELFLRTLEINGYDVRDIKFEAEELMNNNEFDGPQDLSIPDDLADLFVTTGDLTALEHGSVQCAVQEGVDSAISKTVNAPNDATLEDAKIAFEYVYDNGGKGVTYYRDGTRTKQVLTTRKDNQIPDEDALNDDVVDAYLKEEYNLSIGEVQRVDDLREKFEGTVSNLAKIGEDTSQSVSDESPVPTIRDRPNVLEGTSYKINTGHGHMYVTVNDLDGKPFEVLATVGKSGGQMESMLEGIARMVSGSLRAGMDVNEVIEQLRGIRGPKVGWHNGQKIMSIPDGIAKVLIKHVEDNPHAGEKAVIGKKASDGGGEPLSKNLGVESNGQLEKNVEKSNAREADIECPECHMMDVYISEGCKTCESCGWSQC